MQEIHCEGHVIVELIEIEIHPVRLHDTHTDELGHQLTNHRITTNNLLVKRGTRVSWDTPMNDHEGPLRPLGLGVGFLQVIVDPGFILGQRRAIFEHHLISRLLLRLRSDTSTNHQSHDDETFHVASVTDYVL